MLFVSLRIRLMVVIMAACTGLAVFTALLGILTPRQVISFVTSEGYTRKLYLLDVRTGIVLKLSDQPVTQCCPIWSPDGSQVAFTGNELHPFMINLSDGITRRVAPDTLDGGWVDGWSPEGKQLLITGFENIYRIDVDGANPVRLISANMEGFSPVWSPDGRFIIFVSGQDGNWEIYRINADGSGVRRLTFNPAADFYPSVSAKGGQIAFISNRDGNNEVYVIDADGGHLQRLTWTESTENAPSWSPDGGRVLFIVQRVFSNSLDIGIINADGTNLNYPIHHVVLNGLPLWSPDGTRIVYVSQVKPDDPEIYVADADGSNPLRLTNNLRSDTFPAWQP